MAAPQPPVNSTWTQEWLTRVGVMTSRPAAFAIVVLYAFAWLLFDSATFDWHGVATISTWLMTLMIQRASHRDTQALQAKLDELLRHDPHARSELEHLDEQEPEQIEAHRDTERG